MGISFIPATGFDSAGLPVDHGYPYQESIRPVQLYRSAPTSCVDCGLECPAQTGTRVMLAAPVRCHECSLAESERDGWGYLADPNERYRRWAMSDEERRERYGKR